MGRREEADEEECVSGKKQADGKGRGLFVEVGELNTSVRVRECLPSTCEPTIDSCELQGVTSIHAMNNRCGRLENAS